NFDRRMRPSTVVRTFHFEPRRTITRAVQSLAPTHEAVVVHNGNRVLLCQFSGTKNQIVNSYSRRYLHRQIPLTPPLSCGPRKPPPSPRGPPARRQLQPVVSQLGALEDVVLVPTLS